MKIRNIVLAIVLQLVGFRAGAQLRLDYPQNQAKVLAQAKRLGSPMLAVRRAMLEASKDDYTNKEAIAVFDISQRSNQKRFYLLDFKNAVATANFAAHGRGNGDNYKTTHFRGFQDPAANMTPLGPLRTAPAMTVIDEYATVQDQYDGKVYSGLYILNLQGMAAYNARFNDHDMWVILHSKWYVTEGYRKANPNGLGRSLGCIVLDPTVSNHVFSRLQGGGLVYVTVGNDPVEKYL